MAAKEKKATEKKARFKNLEDLPIAITDWIGSTKSLLVHTLFFIGIFILYFLGFEFDTLMLFLTTIVSLEAIYLAIFIQMTVNRNTQSLQEVEEDIDEIQEDVEEIEKDIDEIQEDVEGMEKDIDEIQIDVEGMEKDLDEIQEDVDRWDAEDIDEATDEERGDQILETIGVVEKRLQKIIEDIETLKQQKKK